MKETNLELFDKDKADLAEYQKSVEEIEINNANDMLLATWLKNKIQSTIKHIDSVKELLNRPVLDLKNAINKKYKETLQPFKDIKEELWKKQIAYQKEVDRKAEEARKIIEEAAKEVEETEAVKEIVDNELSKINNEYEHSRMKWTYQERVVEEIDFFNIDKKYLNIKPLEIKADLLKIKRDLKEWKTIGWIKATLVDKIR